MKRTPMKRGAPLARTSRMKARSTKASARYAGTDGKGEGRAAFVARVLRERPTCEAGRKIGRTLAGCEPTAERERSADPRWDQCRHDPVDVHELLRRSAGGSLTDPANVLAVCRACHQWIHAHPALSYRLDLLRSRYATDESADKPTPT